MMHFFHITLLSSVLLTLSACNETRSIRSQLNDADLLVNEKPDSVLNMLQSYDISSLRNASLKNHYYLLLTQAKDKCYIDETDDSLMTTVVDYYKRHRNSEKLFLSYFYLGRIQQNAGNNTDAMQTFLEAGQLFDKFDDDFYKGLLCARFGKLFESQLDYNSAVASYKQAYSYYVQSGTITHQYYTLLDIGYSLLYQGKHEEAEENITKVMEWARNNEKKAIYNYCINLLCHLYESDKDYQALDNLLENKNLFSNNNSLTCTLASAYKYARDTQPDKAFKILESSWRMASSISDTARIYHKEYLIHKISGNHSQALDSHEKLLYVQDSIVRAALQSPLQAVQGKYFRAKDAYNSLKAKHYISLFGWLITVLILFCSTIIYIMRYKITRKNEEIIKYTEIADELRHNLYLKECKIAEISSNLAGKDAEICTMEHSIAILFSKQYKLLDKLCTVYYETHGCRKDKEAIYNKVKQEMELFSNDREFIKNLENIVNQNMNNVMAITRMAMPHLSEMDFRLLCFLFSGFSAKAISVFTGDSTGNIYVRKSRLKKEISAIEAPESSFILSQLA